jgi:hypothetical protein
MGRLDQITELTASGQLTDLFRNGLIGYKTLLYRDIYFRVGVNDALGFSQVQSVSNVADEFNVSERTVWRAIKFMKE